MLFFGCRPLLQSSHHMSLNTSFSFSSATPFSFSFFSSSFDFNFLDFSFSSSSFLSFSFMLKKLKKLCLSLVEITFFGFFFSWGISSREISSSRRDESFGGLLFSLFITSLFTSLVDLILLVFSMWFFGMVSPPVFIIHNLLV